MTFYLTWKDYNPIYVSEIGGMASDKMSYSKIGVTA